MRHTISVTVLICILACVISVVVGLIIGAIISEADRLDELSRLEEECERELFYTHLDRKPQPQSQRKEHKSNDTHDAS